MKAICGAINAFRSGEGLKGQLLRGGMGSMAIKIGSTGLNVLLAIVLARALGAEGFGVYSFVFALITIMAIPAQMGLPNLVVRETAKAQASGDWALMKGLWRWSTLMALMMSGALMAIGALAAWIFSSRLPEGGLTVFYWGLVLVPLVALGNLRGAALRGLRHVIQGQLPEFILRPAFFIALVLGAHFGLSTRALAASDAMMLHALASLAAFVIGAWLLLKVRLHESRLGDNAIVHSRAWLRSALPLGLIEGMQLINQNVGLIILGIFAGAQDVGYLRVAIQGATLVAFGLQVVNVVAAPHVARLYAKDEIKTLERLARYCARISLLVAGPVSLAYFLFGREILEMLFGAEFTAAYWPLVILAAGQVVNASAASVGVLLSMTRNERDIVMALSIAATANLVLGVALIPLYGVEGAAIAGASSTAFWNIWLWRKVRLRLGITITAITFPFER